MEDIIALLSTAEEHVKKAEEYLADKRITALPATFERFDEVQTRIQTARRKLNGKMSALYDALVGASYTICRDGDDRLKPKGDFWLVAGPLHIRPSDRYQSELCIKGIGSFNFYQLVLSRSAMKEHFWVITTTLGNFITKYLQQAPQSVLKDTEQLTIVLDQLREETA